MTGEAVQSKSTGAAAGKDACLVKIKPAAMMRPSAGAIHISLKAANNV